jgi:cysteate synthase
MYDAWRAGSREIIFPDEDIARENALKITAKVLSNRRPPYSVPGGLFDALKDTSGDIESVTNSELNIACEMFEELEGIDIHPAAGVALAGMIKSLDSLKADRDAVLMLNITGGGERFLKSQINPYYLKPNLILSNKLSNEAIIKQAELLF